MPVQLVAMFCAPDYITADAPYDSPLESLESCNNFNSRIWKWIAQQGQLGAAASTALGSGSDSSCIFSQVFRVRKTRYVV